MSRRTEFWRDRRVLLTGHTGFKGAWLTLWLEARGARVHGVALPPDGAPSLYNLLGRRPNGGETIGDIADPAISQTAISASEPEIVLHLAAQALVRRGYRDPARTYASNVTGTLNLLEAVRGRDGVKTALIVTTDKVYANDGAGRAFIEDDPLGGHDPYSASKACCEILVQSHRASFGADAGACLATARAGNVIGGGDWAEDRLLPDLLRAHAAGETAALRYPDAVRPWQHVLEPLEGYMRFAELMTERPDATPDALNFGPDPDAFLSVGAVASQVHARLSRDGAWSSADPGGMTEAAHLTLNSDRAAAALGWRCRLDASAAIDWTVDWHLALDDGASAEALMRRDIERYEALAE